MNEDPTPINAHPKRRRPEALEGFTLAIREHLVWPLEDRLLGLSDRGRAVVAAGAVALAVGLGAGAYSLAGSDQGDQVSAPVAVAPEQPSPPGPTAKAPEPEPEPTLHGAAPVFKPAPEDRSAQPRAGQQAEATASGSSEANTGDPATDTITSSAAARPAAASAAASASAPPVEGPPAGPEAIATARKFAAAFVVYETGGSDDSVRKAFGATATPELVKALLRRPPRQPAGAEVPKAKVLNVVPAPSHEKIYPLSISLLRVGATSELRLEMEQLKNKGWRVTNVLG